MYSKQAIIERTDLWQLVSLGYGAAYTMTDLCTNWSRFCQGDDADAFRESYSNMQEAYANPDSVWHLKTWNECLAELWEQLPHNDQPD